jgi:photosynthetic reaction center cytochrome c subunit
MSQTRIIPLAAATLPLLLGACEIGSKAKTQSGFRGTGMDQIVNDKYVLAQAAIPANAYATPDDSGPRAGATYQNVKVLGGVSTERFNHFMAQMNNWVAPQSGDPAQQGCNYCHNPNNMASDEKYTKVVARRMIQMTQNINANWTDHVKQTGVTCWTCHRGNVVPNYRWAMAAPGGISGTITGNKRGQNTPDAAVAYASLPYDPFSAYLKDGGVNGIRVASNDSHPSPDHVVPIKDAEKTYGLMMHLSKGLGVNCTYCHNTQSFRGWTNSTPARVTAWYGLRMVAKTNAEYMTPLASVFPAVHVGAVGPAARKGPMGDTYKINCATCHNGLNKPMNGVSMRAENPVLWGAAVAAPVAATLMAPKADPNATAASCDADFAKALAGKTIEFDTGKATIRDVSTPLLDNLVQIAGRCSRFKMSVEGHTDATGNAGANMTLSQSRAASVDKYLSDHGVAASQIVATGYGQTRPIDTSGTPAGNQRNRRIEINVGAATGGGTANGR